MLRVALTLWFLSFLLSAQSQQRDFNRIDFTKADAMARHYQGEQLYNIPLLVYNLTDKLTTDVEKFRAIYFWVTHNISNDIHLVFSNERKRSKYKNSPESLRNWNNNFKKKVIRKLIEDKKTLCTGYAFLVQAMSKQAGLECEIINGYGLANNKNVKHLKSPNHSWNAIKLNDTWYLADATWASGYTDMKSLLFFFDYDDSFFLMEPERFGKDHKPENQEWSLIPEKSL